MKQKDMYTLEELYGNLKISLSKLSKLSGINEGTLTRIRKGYSARVETINKLLEAFSETYGIEFSRENVSGFTLEDKKAIRNRSLVSKGITEKAIEPPIDNKMAVDIKPLSVTQKHIVVPSEGTMLLKDFADLSGIPLRTLHNWREAGRIETSHRDRPGGGGIEYLISSDEQEKARQFRAQKPGKRQTSHKSKKFPPEGSITTVELAHQYGVPYPDIHFQIHTGIGPGMIEDKEQLQVTRDPRGDYLTIEQITAALQYWHKHGIKYKSSTTETGEKL